MELRSSTFVIWKEKQGNKGKNERSVTLLASSGSAAFDAHELRFFLYYYS